MAYQNRDWKWQPNSVEVRISQLFQPEPNGFTTKQNSKRADVFSSYSKGDLIRFFDAFVFAYVPIEIFFKSNFENIGYNGEVLVDPETPLSEIFEIKDVVVTRKTRLEPEIYFTLIARAEFKFLISQLESGSYATEIYNFVIDLEKPEE